MDEERIEVLDLGFAAVKPQAIMAVAVADIPANPTTPEYYVVYVYLFNVAQPLVLSYNKVEDRNAAYEVVKSKM